MTGVPSEVVANRALPAIVVVVEDAHGNRVTGVTTRIGLVVETAGGAGRELAARDSVLGVATFDGVVVDASGVVSLVARAPGLSSPASELSIIMPSGVEEIEDGTPMTVTVEVPVTMRAQLAGVRAVTIAFNGDPSLLGSMGAWLDVDPPTGVPRLVVESPSLAYIELVNSDLASAGRGTVSIIVNATPAALANFVVYYHDGAAWVNIPVRVEALADGSGSRVTADVQAVRSFALAYTSANGVEVVTAAGSNESEVVGGEESRGRVWIPGAGILSVLAALATASIAVALGDRRRRRR